MRALLAPSEAAELLGVTVGTLSNWRSARNGPPWVRIGARVAYRPEDLERWVAARVQPGDGSVTAVTPASRRRRAS